MSNKEEVCKSVKMRADDRCKCKGYFAVIDFNRTDEGYYIFTAS